MAKERAYVRIGDRVTSIAGMEGTVIKVPRPGGGQGGGYAQRHFYVTVEWDNGATGKCNPAHALTRESWSVRS